MPRKQTEDVNQSARQLADQEPDNARQSSGGQPQRPKSKDQGLVKDRRNDLQPADRKRAQSNR